MRKLLLFLALAVPAYCQLGNANRIQSVPVKAPLSCSDGYVITYVAANNRFECLAGGGGGGSGTVTSVGLAGTANQITVTGTSPITSSGSWTLSFPTNVTLPGNTTGTFIGNLTGNASGTAGSLPTTSLLGGVTLSGLTGLSSWNAGIPGVASGSVVTEPISAPSIPTVTPQGATGATTYTYCIVAVRDSAPFTGTVGWTECSTVRTITNGNATLDGTNFNRITWSAVTGAASYNIYRTAHPMDDIGLIDSTSSLTTDDTGLSGDGNTPPTRNGTGRVLISGFHMQGGNLGSTITFVPDDTLFIKEEYSGNADNFSTAIAGEVDVTAGSGEVYGVQGQVRVNNPNTFLARGGDFTVFQLGSGTVSSAKAVSAGFLTQGPITNAYGFFYDTTVNIAGSITNEYGIYISDVTVGTNKWAIKAGTGKVEFDDLKTTGSATGKKVVCVDTTTGILYASSSGVACAN